MTKGRSIQGPESRRLLDRLRRVRHVLLDLDGTVYLGRKTFPWTAPFLDLLRELKIGRTFLTNNNSRSFSQYLEKLRGLGIGVGPEDLYTSTLATIDYLRESHPSAHRLFILGTPSLRAEFRAAGFEESGETPVSPPGAKPEGVPGAAASESCAAPDAVVVGFDTTLSYPRLCRAAHWIARAKPFIATHPDRVCPTDEETVLPDCGSFCALLAHATGRGPEAVCGKPSPRMVLGAAKGRGVSTEEIAVVGDRLYTDMRMARESGALGVLVLTGETTAEEAAATPGAADLVVQDLFELGELLARAHGRTGPPEGSDRR